MIAGSVLLGTAGAHPEPGEKHKHIANVAWKPKFRKAWTKQQADNRFLLKNEKAADSSKLDGAEVLYARVDAEGDNATLVDGNGATSAGGSALDGRYSVLFNRPVGGCVKHITAQEVRPPTDAATIEPSQFFVWVFASSPNRVRVDRRDQTGASDDFSGGSNGFALTLVC